MNSKIIEIDGIGKIKFVKSTKAKRLNIIVKPIEGVRVSIPRGVSLKMAKAIVLERKVWINEKLNLMKDVENRKVIFDEFSVFYIKNYSFVIERNDGDENRYKISKDKILIKINSIENIKDEKNQHYIRNVIDKGLRRAAKSYLPKRTEELAKKHGLKFKKVFIKNAKTRWGSCSGVNNINLNMHLMRLPDELIDYVILHELAHIIEKNHSKKYWEYLDGLVKGAKIIDKKMKSYDLRLY